MRLLHTERLEFEEFFDSETPDYASLSHRWTRDEVSFRNFHHCKQRRAQNFAKIENYCALAWQNGYEWVWIDTCCIDKTSSAELTEAINSMYSWYEKASVCHAYLADVSLRKDGINSWDETRNEFIRSDWFTRGWTLQELLAPSMVHFLDRSWRFIGYKGFNFESPGDLEHEISLATGISELDLQLLPQSQPTAKKLSWVSRRNTTRAEDIAYCMLGLCNVNMPLLYGEGNKAFIRLQQEIIKDQDDESIFAWFCDYEGEMRPFTSGLIAPSPRCFAKSGQVVHYTSSILKGKRPYSMTNKGLAYIIPRPKNWPEGQLPAQPLFPLLLQCGTPDAWVVNQLCRLGHHRNDQFPLVTIELIFIASNWYRVQGRTADFVFSSPDLWNASVPEQGSSFDTIYIRGTNLLITVLDLVYPTNELDEFLAVHKAMKGEISEHKGLRYDIRHHAMSIQN